MSPNAGGNSVFSEVLSYSYIKALLNQHGYRVRLSKTEMELKYVEGSKITDYSLAISNMKGGIEIIGCSVTRCFDFHDLDRSLPYASVERLLVKKLLGINCSTEGVINEQWQRQILHIFCPNDAIAKMINNVLADLAESVVSNTIVLITVTDCPCIYFERSHHVEDVLDILMYN